MKDFQTINIELSFFQNSLQLLTTLWIGWF